MIKARKCDAHNCLNYKDGNCRCNAIRLDHKGRCREWCIAEVEMKKHTDIISAVKNK